MIINRQGQSFAYEDISYIIGAPIIGTDESEYHGLFGHITEIRDGEDKDTDNETPDIYCSFEAPVLPCEVKALEEIFSGLYDEPKQLSDITLDAVVMAPSMIRPLNDLSGQGETIAVYMVIEDWVSGGETQQSCELFADYDSAKRSLNAKLLDEMENGAVPSWKGDTGYVEESSKDSYSCYIDGEYCENHYDVSIRQQAVQIPAGIIDRIGDVYLKKCLLEDFISQIAEWDQLDELTDEQYKQMLRDPALAEMLDTQVSANDHYWEAYWESVSEVAFKMIKKYAENGISDAAVPDVPVEKERC